MASKAASKAIHPLKSKYTQQSSGVWETIRRLFAVDPDRSNGIPVKHYRNPTPGGLDPKDYDDAVTLPAADIADNPYWKRDVRRNYPKASAVTQGDVVGLLSVGSAKAPSDKLLPGEEGGKMLVAVKSEGDKGLSVFFEKEKGVGAGVLGEGGMPPRPVAVGKGKDEAKETHGVRGYQIEEEQSYTNQYPCRSFS